MLENMSHDFLMIHPARNYYGKN